MDKFTFLPNHQPLINKEYKFIYQPITKVACKTIKTWMLSLLKRDLVVNMGENTFGKSIEMKHMNNNDNFNIHDYSVKLFRAIGESNKENTGIKITEYVKILDENNFQFTSEIKNYFKFTFVRNPWERVVSSYMEKFRNVHGITYPNAKKINDTIEIIPKKYFDRNGVILFDGFVDILYRGLKSSKYTKFDIHWMPQYIISDMYVKNYDFVGKLENFESDFDKILETLNIDIKPKYKIGSSSHTFQAHKEFYKNNPELINKVAEIYKEDIKRYNYEFSDLEK